MVSIMSDEVQDPVDEQVDDIDELDPTEEEQNEKKKKKDKKEKKGKKGKKTLPSYFTEKDLAEPQFQRQEALNWLLGLDNPDFISRSAKITFIGSRKRYVPKQKVLVGKRSPRAKNNNWKLFHVGKPFFKGQPSNLPIKDVDFIRLALSQKKIFKVKFVKEKPLKSKEARKLYQAPKESQLNLSYRVKLARLRSGHKTAVTLEEAHRALKDIGDKGPIRKELDLKHIQSFLQAIIEKETEKKKK